MHSPWGLYVTLLRRSTLSCSNCTNWRLRGDLNFLVFETLFKFQLKLFTKWIFNSDVGRSATWWNQQPQYILIENDIRCTEGRCNWKGWRHRVYRTRSGTKWGKVTHEVTSESRETLKNYLLTRWMNMQLIVKWYRELAVQEQSGEGVKLTTLHRLERRLRGAEL
jgi:hypothetical protein